MAIKTNQAIKISQKHLLGIQDLSINDVNLILDEANSFIKVCASSRIKFISLIDKSWIPNKCFWEILTALLVLIAIKTNSITIKLYNSKY